MPLPSRPWAALPSRRFARSCQSSSLGRASPDTSRRSSAARQYGHLPLAWHGPAAAVATLGTGNSLGPEGPSVEIGVSISRLAQAASRRGTYFLDAGNEVRVDAKVGSATCEGGGGAAGCGRRCRVWLQASTRLLRACSSHWRSSLVRCDPRSCAHRQPSLLLMMVVCLSEGDAAAAAARRAASAGAPPSPPPPLLLLLRVRMTLMRMRSLLVCPPPQSSTRAAAAELDI